MPKKCKFAFNIQILYYKRTRDIDSERELEAKYVDLETLLKKSAVVSLHCPLNQETFHIIGKSELKLMKKDSFLINTGRGGLVDEEDLIKALQKGKIAGYGTDVFEKEMPDPASPLLKMENVVATPNIAAHSKEAFKKNMDSSSQEHMLNIRETVATTASKPCQYRCN